MTTESMGTLGRTMKASRLTMIGSEANRIAEDFLERFDMRDGDYISYYRFRGAGHEGVLLTTGRILSVENCYYNSVGGYTAIIHVAPLLCGGRLGTSRILVISRHANGGRIKNLKCSDTPVVSLSE